MRLKSLIFLACAAVVSLLAVHCMSADSVAKFELGNAAAVVPMNVNVGTTQHYLTDYYPYWVGADDVTSDDERIVLSNTSGDWSEFELKTEAEVLVSTIDVWHEGEALAIVVLGGKRDTEGIADPASPEEIITTVSTSELDRIFADKNGDAPDSYAIVTSGTYQRNFIASGKVYHHIMDVETGFPCENGLSSVTVICDNGGLADGLSTTLFLLGYEGAMEYYREHGGFEAVFITDEGEILKTDGLASLDAE